MRLGMGLHLSHSEKRLGGLGMALLLSPERALGLACGELGMGMPLSSSEKALGVNMWLGMSLPLF